MVYKASTHASHQGIHQNYVLYIQFPETGFCNKCANDSHAVGFKAHILILPAQRMTTRLLQRLTGKFKFLFMNRLPLSMVDIFLSCAKEDGFMIFMETR